MHRHPRIAIVLFCSLDYPPVPGVPRWIDLKFPELPEVGAERRRRDQRALAMFGGIAGILTAGI